MFDCNPSTKGTPIDLAGKPGKHQLVITVSFLELMKRFEGTDAAQFNKYLKGFSVKLDQLSADSDTAYAALKEEVYSLVGNLVENKPATAFSVEGSLERLAPENAVDGFSSTRRSSAYIDDTWFQIDLGNPKNSIRLVSTGRMLRLNLQTPCLRRKSALR